MSEFVENSADLEPGKLYMVTGETLSAEVEQGPVQPIRKIGRPRFVPLFKGAVIMFISLERETNFDNRCRFLNGEQIVSITEPEISVKNGQRAKLVTAKLKNLKEVEQNDLS